MARTVATRTTAFRLETRLAAFDVEEFLRAQVGTEAGLGHDIVGQLEGGLRRNYRVAAVGDISERAAVHERRIVFERLHQVRLHCVLQQDAHCAFCLDVAAVYGAAVATISDDHVAQALLQILEVTGEAENGHYLGSHGDVETSFTRETVGDATERGGDLTQGAVVHVDHAAPGDAANVDVERVAPVDVVVEHRRQQIVGTGDRMEVTGEVEVHVLHRHDLGVAATRGATLHAEVRAERRLTDADRGLFADLVEAVTKTDSGRRLAFTSRRRVDRRHQDQVAVRAAFKGLDEIRGNLGLVMAKREQMLGLDTQLRANFLDGLLVCLTGNFDIGHLLFLSLFDLTVPVRRAERCPRVDLTQSPSDVPASRPTDAAHSFAGTLP